MTSPAPSTQPKPHPRVDDFIVRGCEEMFHGRVIPSPAAAFPNNPKTAEVACIAWGLARGLGKGIDWPRLQDALYTLRTERRWP